MDAHWQRIEAEQRWCYVRAGFASGTAFVLFFVWCAALCSARRRSDPSRAGVGWFKAVPPFEVVGLVLLAASDFALSSFEFLSYQHDGRPGNLANRNSILLAYNVYSRTISIGAFLRSIADALLLIAFVELGNGLMFALTRERRNTSRAVLRWAAVAIGLVLIILASARVALANTVLRDQWYGIFNIARGSRPETWSAGDISRIESLAAEGRPYLQLSGAYNILNFGIAVGVLIYASVVMHHYAHVLPSRVCAVNLLLASILNLVRWTWFLVVSALWILPEDGPSVPRTLGVTYAGEAFMDYVLSGIVLIILYSITTRRKKGLWTTLQPWMKGVPPTTVVKQRPVRIHQTMHQPMQQPVGYYPNGHPPQGYPAAPYPYPYEYPQPMPPAWYHPGQQPPVAQYVYMPPQEAGGVARHEIPAAEVAHELEKGNQRESTRAASV